MGRLVRAGWAQNLCSVSPFQWANAVGDQGDCGDRLGLAGSDWGSVVAGSLPAAAGRSPRTTGRFPASTERTNFTQNEPGLPDDRAAFPPGEWWLTGGLPPCGLVLPRLPLKLAKTSLEGGYLLPVVGLLSSLCAPVVSSFFVFLYALWAVLIPPEELKRNRNWKLKPIA